MNHSTVSQCPEGLQGHVGRAVLPAGEHWRHRSGPWQRLVSGGQHREPAGEAQRGPTQGQPAGSGKRLHHCESNPPHLPGQRFESARFRRESPNFKRHLIRPAESERVPRRQLPGLQAASQARSAESSSGKRYHFCILRRATADTRRHLRIQCNI